MRPPTKLLISGAAVVILAAGAGPALASGGQPPAPGPVVSTSGGGGGGGGGGTSGGGGAGGKTPPPPSQPNTFVGKLPTTWPTTLPVPAGQIINSAGLTPKWTVQMLLNGNATVVKATLVKTYQGFSVVPNQAIPFTLVSPRYKIDAFMAPRDHSNTKTILVEQVTQLP